MKSDRSVKLLTTVAVVGVLAFVTFCGFQLSNLSTSYSIRQFFPKNHPALNADAKLEKTFQLRSNPAYFVTLQLPNRAKMSWLEPKRIEVLRDLTTEISSLKNVKSAISLATVEMAITEKNELRVGTVFDSLPQKRWKKFIESQALLMPQLISKDQKSVLIAIETETASSEGLAAVEHSLKQTLRHLGPGVTTGIAGVPAVQSRLADLLQVEVTRFLFLCLALFCFMFVLFYRNWSPVLFAVVGLVISNVTVLGLMALAGMPFTVLLSTLPIIVSITFVSLAIHTLHLWADRLSEQGRPAGLAARSALSWKVLREIALPNFLGSLTTAIGFATLATAPIPAIRDYALIVAGGVMWTWVVAQILLWIVMPYVTPLQRAWTRRKAWWTVSVTRWSGTVFVSVIGISVFLGLCGINLNFSARLFDDLPAKEPVRVAASVIDEKFGGTVNLELSLDAGKAEAWKDPAALRSLRQALAEIRTLPGVGSALGLPDFLGEKTPKTRGAVAEILFLFSMAAENPVRNFVDNSSRQTRLSLRMQDLPSSQIDRIRESARKILQGRFPKATLTEAGLAVNSHTINREVARELVFGFWQALVVIGVLLLVVFRSLRWALIACVPNLVTPAILIGALALMQTPVKPVIALIFSIALGLAFNNTVYLLSRLRRIQKENGMTKLPLRRTLLEEGMPCLSESLLTFAGFLIFLSSDFKLNQTFGAYMVLSIFAGALGDLVFLPAMLKLFPELLTGPLNKHKKSKLILVVSNSDLKTTDVETDEKKSNLPPAAAAMIAVVVLAGLMVPVKTHADEAMDVLQKVRQNLESNSDQATVTLKIIEANGDVKTRKLTLKTWKNGRSFHAMARVLAPADIKGTAVLAEMKDGSESQWLYLPSSRQVRRVVSGKKSAGVLGSELSAEDLNSAAIQGATVKVAKKSEGKVWLEVKPKAGTSEYTRVGLLISMPQGLPLKTDYYVGSKIKKTVEFKDYITVGGSIQRAQKIIVKNLLNRRGTEVELADLKVNLKFKESDFSVSALKRAD